MEIQIKFDDESTVYAKPNHILIVEFAFDFFDPGAPKKISIDVPYIEIS